MAEMDSEAVVIDTHDLKVLVKLSVLDAFSEDTTLDKLKSCMSSLLQPFKDALVKANSEIDSLKAGVADKGRIIQKMSVDIEELERKYDDIEQHDRKGSVRIFGVPENIQGDTDSKVIYVFNEMMNMDPPISMEDLGVTHRVDKPSLPSGQIDQPAPGAQPVYTWGGWWGSYCLCPIFWWSDSSFPWVEQSWCETRQTCSSPTHIGEIRKQEGESRCHEWMQEAQG